MCQQKGKIKKICCHRTVREFQYQTVLVCCFSNLLSDDYRIK